MGEILLSNLIGWLNFISAKLWACDSTLYSGYRTKDSTLTVVDDTSKLHRSCSPKDIFTSGVVTLYTRSVNYHIKFVTTSPLSYLLTQWVGWQRIKHNDRLLELRWEVILISREYLQAREIHEPSCTPRQGIVPQQIDLVFRKL